MRKWICSIPSSSEDGTYIKQRTAPPVYEATAGNSKDDSFGSKTNSSRYIFMTENSPTAVSKFLDWISTCLWKCSPGCQQLPDHYQ